MLNGLGDKPELCVPVNIQTVRRFVPTEQVFEDGLFPTREFLESLNIPYQEMIDPHTNGGVFVINTANGFRQLPPILTKEQSEEVKRIALMNWCMSVPGDNQPKPGDKPGKKIPWLWIALGGAALILLTNEDKNRDTGDVKSGLSGVPKKHKGPKKPKRKLKVVSI